MESEPFAGIVLCCTSIPVDLRTDIAKKTIELGGVHKHDLTHEVTHLVVGDYNTPKYRHVAYQRPDIKVMCAGWVDAVLDLWTRDAEIDMATLEAQWRLRAFESHGGLPTGPDGASERGRLLISVSGFTEEERDRVIQTITNHGGVYSGDLTRAATHLIVNQPSGNKYDAALLWGVKTVAVEWLDDCVARGMILDEADYDPRLPKAERGKGHAWVRSPAQRAAILGKRQRDAAAAAAAVAEKNGQRKLRKTTSQKLTVQRNSLWGDILGSRGQQQQQQQQQPEHERPLQQQPQPQKLPGPPAQVAPPPLQQLDPLAASIFCILGFPRARQDILANAVATIGGTVASSLEHMAAMAASRPPGTALQHVIVPQTERPEAHPAVPPGVVLVTEFFVEKCLHKKRYPFPEPGSTDNTPDASVIGRPFPFFPIRGFDTLSICSAGFSGVDLNHIDKTVRQLGATYEERFTPQRSLLLVQSLGSVRPEKLDLALSAKIPVVHVRWLWSCIVSGTLLPVARFLFPQLRQQPPPTGPLSGGIEAAAAAAAPTATKSPQPATVPTMVVAPSEESMFVTQNPPLFAQRDDDGNAILSHDEAEDTITPFETAATHQSSPDKTQTAQAKAQPQTRPPPPPPPPPPQSKRQPLARVVSEIADSDDGDAGDDLNGSGRRNSTDAHRPPTITTGSDRPPRPAMQRSATTTMTAQQQHRTALGRVASENGHRRLPPPMPPMPPALGPAKPAPIGISIGDLMKDSISSAGRTVAAVGRRGSDAKEASDAATAPPTAASSGISISAGAAAAPTPPPPAPQQPPLSETRTTPVPSAVSVSAAAAAQLPAPTQTLPAPTQIEVQYLEPEAERIRERLMRKILNTGEGDDDSEVTAAEETGQETRRKVSSGSVRARRRSGRLR